MKNFLAMLVIAFILLISYSTACLAKDMYVGDINKLNLRSGKGVKYRVITTLGPGERVTVISTAGEWTKIGTMDGNEGWVVSRYLTSEKPAKIKIEDLKIQMETLQEQLEIAALEKRKLKEENISLTTCLNENSIKLGNVEKSFNDLKTDSREYITLKEKYDKIAKEVNKKDARIKSLEKKVDDQYIAIAIKWSLTGAGILLAGFFLGSRTKRKRSSLL
ncbi:MAG: TIGR04211 family SH3 domain-containing protein [Desulfobacteraceae bacterium]|nr:TIGR04211 family SH3 domain-containing protein [Desulfobacteraceae bacterium]MBC2755330.1 TIGR04211 family SH3 domain-containing protein [Desulfobacteraceae bacterium]